MEFSIDKNVVTEGDIIEVKWNCPDCQNITITINNGFKLSSLSVDNQGIKKFKLNRSKGKTSITLEALCNGKNIKKSHKVKVNPLKTAKTKGDKKGYDSYKRLDTNPVKDWFNKTKSRFSIAWRSMSREKQLIYKIMMMLLLVMIITSFAPKFIFFGLMAVVIYLFILFRKSK